MSFLMTICLPATSSREGMALVHDSSGGGCSEPKALARGFDPSPKRQRGVFVDGRWPSDLLTGGTPMLPSARGSDRVGDAGDIDATSLIRKPPKLSWTRMAPALRPLLARRSNPCYDGSVT